MSDAVTIALITGLAAGVPAVTAQVIGLILASRRGVGVDQKLQGQSEKLDTIGHQTNSNLTEQKEQIQRLNDRIQSLILEKGKAQGPDDYTNLSSNNKKESACRLSP